MSEPLITLERVSKVYQVGEENFTALNDVNLEVGKGAFMSFVGPSGSGKTTLLNLIGGLDNPTSGTVTVEGKPIHQLKDNELINFRLQHIGFVFQAYNLIPVLSARENVEFIMLLQGQSKQERESRAKELLQAVGLEQQMHKRPSELSGGQQQRVGIARALMENPSVLLMDEPFGALDPITRGSLHEELLNLNRELKKTILIVTHDISEAFKLGDQIILMDNGKIIQSGSADDFRDRPVNLMVKNFIQGQLND